jgi:predicted RNA-binding protein YlxR (DUF448 family)
MRPKKELIRVVRSPEGELALDTRGKMSGRGAYLCPNAECFKKVRKSRALERALEVPIPSEIYEALLARLKSEVNGGG